LFLETISRTEDDLDDVNDRVVDIKHRLHNMRSFFHRWFRKKPETPARISAKIRYKAEKDV